jgi:hypothetical protein
MAGDAVKRVDVRTRFAIGRDFSTHVVNLSAPRKKTGLALGALLCGPFANAMRINGAGSDRPLARVMHEAACNRLRRIVASHAARAQSERAFVGLQPSIMGSSRVACIFPAPGRMPEERL